MVHVSDATPTLSTGLPKSPSFHQDLAFAAYSAQEFNKFYPAVNTLYYQQPLQPLLIGNHRFQNSFFFNVLHVRKHCFSFLFELYFLRFWILITDALELIAFWTHPCLEN